MPEMASLEVFGGGAMPGVGPLAWANVKAEVLALVGDFHVLPKRYLILKLFLYVLVGVGV